MHVQVYTPWVFLAQEHVHGPAVQVPLDGGGAGAASPVRRPATSISGMTGIALLASSTAQQYMYPDSVSSLAQSTQGISPHLEHRESGHACTRLLLVTAQLQGGRGYMGVIGSYEYHPCVGLGVLHHLPVVFGNRHVGTVEQVDVCGVVVVVWVAQQPVCPGHDQQVPP